MATLLYDGSFEGLLCAFRAALEAGEQRPQFESETGGMNGWLFDAATVATEPDIARAVCADLRVCGGNGTVQALAYNWLADVPGFEGAAFETVRLTFERRASVLDWRNNDAVEQVNRLASKVVREAHKMTGLLRFMRLRDGGLYAPYAPDHNISALLARHFRERLSAERWVIHDRHRGLAVAWDGDELRSLAEIPERIEALASEEEAVYQDLWRQFTRSVAIKSRENPRLQRQFMPRRYWDYLTEMRGRARET
jgi:probable DNA metabolism protein